MKAKLSEIFRELRDCVGGAESLQRLSSDEIAGLVVAFPGLPAAYWEFLREIGHGNLGPVVIYAAPIDPVEVYGDGRTESLRGVILFGDDMQGFCYGFALAEGYRVVEVDPRGGVDRTIAPGFADFLRFMLYADGVDG